MDNVKQKQKKNQDESNILVAIRVRPLNTKENNSGDWDIIRVQDNLIVNYHIFRSYSIPLNVSFRLKIKKCWMSFIAPKSKDMLSIKYIENKNQPIFINRLSNLLSKLSSTVKMLLSSLTGPRAREKHILCQEIRRHTV